MAIREIYIKELLDENYNFLVPAYQRGFRWTNHETSQFLKDITKFIQEKEANKENAKYSLQPIVVKKKIETIETIKDKYKKIFHRLEYILIDGQQRLTFIYILCKYFEEFSKYKLFSLEYETREGSKEFLEKINEQDKNNDCGNIDFHHMSMAYKNIENVLKEENIKKFFETLLNKVCVFWYEIGDDNELDVFERLNIGKIQLTDVELIKAMFLSRNQNNDDVNKVKEKAEEWYKIEQDLRENEDEIYYFYNTYNKDINKNSDRIMFYLKFYYEQLKNYYEQLKNKEYNNITDFYYEKYKENKLDNIWNQIKNIARIFKSFVKYPINDKEGKLLYHLLGFIIVLNKNNIKHIINKDESSISLKNKDEIKSEVINIINNLILIDEDTDTDNKVYIKGKEPKNKLYLDDLEYGEKYKRDIKNLLLFYDIILHINDKQSKEKFKFNIYKKQNYSLEHIHAQNSESLESYIKKANKDKEAELTVEWFKEVSSYFQYILKDTTDDSVKAKVEELIRNIDNLVNNNLEYSSKDEEGKEQYKESILEQIDEINGDNINGIGNLVLLEQSTNISLSNSLFQHKKKKLEKSNEYMLKQTRQIFYNSDIKFWGPKEKGNHANNINSAIVTFMGNLNKDN